MSQLNQLGKYADHLASNFVWANTYGLGRALLAMSLMITMVFNDLQMLITRLGTDVEMGQKVLMPMAKLSLYQLLPEQILLIKAFTILVLFLVIIGWRPRVTGIFHWWVTFSFTTSAVVVDGGDQIAQVLSLLLIPLCLADNRKWHWSTVVPALGKEMPMFNKVTNLLAITTLFIIQLQVAFIYFHAGIGKMAVEEWTNGTSIFYWIQNPLFGSCDTLRPAMIALFSNPYIITITTWGVMLLEVLLFMGIAMSPKWRSALLKIGILFHFSIIIMHGLVSFFFTMTAALVLYLGPRAGFSVQELIARFKPSPKDTSDTEVKGNPAPALSI